jgi:hypothetical protein
MLSPLPKIADRAFILAAFLPTLLLAVCLLTLFRDHSLAQTWIKALMAKDPGSAVFLLFAVWIIAVFMLALNYWLYRFLEGYMFPSWIADRLKKRNRHRLQCRLQRLENKNKTALERGALWYGLLQEIPLKDDQVLSTRFGNAIRAFEIYPNDIYGADAITIWLRLASVIPKEFTDQINNMRSQVDLFVNCSFFSILIALLAVIRIIVSVITSYSTKARGISFDAIEYLLWSAVSIVAAYVFYRLAVISVPAWGELVKSAFDCYLPALAKQLGFELPQTESERRSFWTTFSQQLLYRRSRTGELLFHIDKWRQVDLRVANKDETPMKPNSADQNRNDDENV